MSAPSGFIPAELPDSLQQIFDFNGYTTYVAGISFGYAYTLKMFKKAFLNLSAVPGIGHRNLTIYKINEEDENIMDISGSFTARISFGYEGKRLYWGLASIVSFSSLKYETVDIASSTGNVKFYIGKRFKINPRKKKKTNYID